jgi:hypothetical protein
LRLYQLNIGITSVSNKIFLVLDFYCALLTLHLSAPFGGHLQVVEYIVTALDIFCVCKPPEDGRQMGPKHVM